MKDKYGFMKFVSDISACELGDEEKLISCCVQRSKQEKLGLVDRSHFTAEDNEAQREQWCGQDRRARILVNIAALTQNGQQN